MTSFQLLVCLLPVVFMLHDLEEIIFLKSFITQNKDYITKRFPRISEKMLPRLERLSTEGFALAVAEEFVQLSVVTFGSVFFGSYYLWLSFFMAFAVHLVMHLVQWLIVRRYIPIVVTSLLALAYCIYTLVVVVDQNIFQLTEILISTAIGIVVAYFNLVFAHKLGEKYDLWVREKGK